MATSENDLRRERARARLAARQARTNPEPPQDSNAPERTLVSYRSDLSGEYKDPDSDLSPEELEKADARRQSENKKTNSPKAISGSLPQNGGFERRVTLAQGSFKPKQRRGLGALLPKILILVLALALVAGLVLLARSCMAKIDELQAKRAAENIEPADPATLPDFFEVSAIVGDELAFRLIEKSVINPDAAWIATHTEEYEQYGAADQRRLIRLAAMDSNAIEFVRGYPDSFPARGGQIGLSAWEGEGVPMYYQYDVRWGFAEYGGEGIGLTGCGPTCLAMAYQYVTGKNDMSPYEMAVFARKNGYVTESEGTYTSFFLDGASSLGLYPQEQPRSADSITWALKNNGVIIANMGPGDFTEGGHYIVLAGVDDEGKLIVNDPFSSVNSSKTWDIDTVISQSVRMVVYYKG